MTPPPPDSAPDESVPTLTPDLVYKRDVLRRRLGDELGDRTFRAWLERSLAAVTPAPEPEEPLVAEPQAEPAPTNDAGNGCDGRAPCPAASPVAAGSIPARRTERTGPAIAAATQRGDLRGRPWSEEEKQAVRERYIAGDAVLDIAAALGRTRNSVLYAINKMGLYGHPDRPCRRARRGGTRRRPAPDPEREALAEQIVVASARHAAEPDTGPEDEDEEPESDIPEPAPAPLRGCLWIEGDEWTPTWCGAPRSPGRPYCIDHCVRAYVTSSGRRFPRGHFERPPEPMAAPRRASA